MFPVEDMKGCIEEWFAEARDIKEVCDTYITIVKETELQYDFIIRERIEDETNK